MIVHLCNAALKTERYAKVKESGKDIQNFLKETNKVLRVSNASNDWRGYVDFVNNRVVNGLARVIMSSLDYFQNEIDPKVSMRLGFDLHFLEERFPTRFCFSMVSNPCYFIGHRQD